MDRVRSVLGAGRDDLLSIFYTVRAERFGGVDRGDRTLSVDRHGVRRRIRDGPHAKACPRRLSLPTAAGAYWQGAFHARRYRAHSVLRLRDGVDRPDDEQDDQLQDDDR